MMLSSDVRNYLEKEFPGIMFYNGTIDRNSDKCIGVYARGRGTPRIAIGGLENTSFSELPISILVHWTENANTCQEQANAIYEHFWGMTHVTVGSTKVLHANMLDPCPVDISRDERNICEMVIRMNLVYER